MKKFLIKVLTFFITIIISSYIIVWVYEKPKRLTYKNGTNIKLNKWNSIKIEKNSFDVIILGSSRGSSAYNPLILDSISKLNSYNMCTGSQHIKESFYMFKEILKFQKPKYLVYEAFLPSFKNSYDFNNLFSNAEFMANEMIYNEFLTEKFLDLLFPVIKYKAYLKQEAINILRGNQKKSYYESSWIKGHRPSNRVNDSIDIKNSLQFIRFLTPIYYQ